MLIRRAHREVRRGTIGAALPPEAGIGFDRRSFLRRSGLLAGIPGSIFGHGPSALLRSEACRSVPCARPKPARHLLPAPP